MIALLVYHGALPWKATNEFMALVDADEALRPYLLNFRFILVDLGPIADEELSRDARLRAGLLALKYTYRPKEQQKILDKIAMDLVDAAEEFVMQILRYLIQTYETVNETAIREIVRKAKPQEELAMMSIFAREMISKGKEDGWQEGMLKGEQKGEQKILLRLLTRRFGTLPSLVLNKINTADLETLELWSDQVLDAQTLEDVFSPDPLH